MKKTMCKTICMTVTLATILLGCQNTRQRYLNKSEEPDPYIPQYSSPIEQTNSNDKSIPDQLEDAVFALVYAPVTRKAEGQKYVTTALMGYLMNLLPQYDEYGKLVKLDSTTIVLSTGVTFYYGGKDSGYFRGLTWVSKNYIFTTGRDKDFIDEPDKFIDAPIYFGTLNSNIQIGKFVLDSEKKLTYVLCEQDFKDVCRLYLSLKTPKKDSPLRKELFAKPKANPLNFFPYQVEFTIELKDKDTSSKNLLSIYKIENEMN